MLCAFAILTCNIGLGLVQLKTSAIVLIGIILVRCSNENFSNPLKEGLSTRLSLNGAIQAFSFEEKEEMKKIAEIENYIPKIVCLKNDDKCMR